MGKTRKTKVHKNKVNPIGLPSAEEEFDDVEGSGPVELVIEQLGSSSVDEKLNGLQMLATLAQNQQSISAIIQSEIIRIAGPFLVDSGLRHATSGAFRNLATCGLEVCDVMVEQDLMTPLLALLNEYQVDWKPVVEENGRSDERGETYLNALNVLWNLCESSSEALEQFNNSQLVNQMVKGLNFGEFGIEISVATAQLLLVVSEDNPSSWKVLHQFEAELVGLLNLEAEGKFPETLLRTLAAGITANVPSLSGQHLERIISSLGKTFNENHRTVLNELSSEIPLENEDPNPANGRNIDIEMMNEENEMESEEIASARRRKPDDLTELEVKIKNAGWLLEAQRVGAEILTNITSYDEDLNKNSGDEDLDSDTESVHDYDTMSVSKDNLCPDKLPVELLEGIRSLNLIEKLWLRAQPIPENVFSIINKRNKNLTKKLKLLRISSLLCLHNLCNGMSIEDLGGAANVYKVWLDLGQQIFQGSSTDVHLLEASTALMRATLEHLKKNPELFAQMTENDLKMMLDGVQECDEAEIRANWLRMLGTMGCLLGETLVKQIVAFVLDACANEADAWTISEAMDSLMDMFSDNDWHQVSLDLNLPQRTKEVERSLKNKLRQQKRELGERYSAVCTVRTNLARFSKYLEAELRNFKPNGK